MCSKWIDQQPPCKSQSVLMSCETVISSFLIQKVQQVAKYLFACGWCILLLFLSTFIAGQKKIREDLIRRREMTRRNDEKRKLRHWVVLVRRPYQSPLVLRFLRTSKNGFSYLRTEKALLFFETQLTSSEVQFFLVVV